METVKRVLDAMNVPYTIANKTKSVKNVIASVAKGRAVAPPASSGLCSQRITASETNSGPLSERRYLGAPWTLTSLASCSMTAVERMLPACKCLTG